MAKPTITQYDQWGRRVDALHTSEGWREMKAISQQEGLPAIFYERQFGEYSRVYGFAKTLLMVGDTQEVFCPMSMTDGAARILELYGNDATKEEYEILKRSFLSTMFISSRRLTRKHSRDPGKGFTAGQWMTEVRLVVLSSFTSQLTMSAVTSALEARTFPSRRRRRRRFKRSTRMGTFIL